MSLRLLPLRLPLKRLLTDTLRKLNASRKVYQDWNWKLQKRLSKTATELLRITAHRRTPKLPFIAMVAPFVFFTVAYSWPYNPLLRSMRFPTRLFVVMQTLTPSPQAYTVSYAVIRYHALLLIPAYTVAYFSTFIFVVSQQITQSLTPAHALTNAITLELQQLHLMY